MPQANPSLAELLHKQFKDKKEKMAQGSEAQVLETYGNVAEAPPEELAALIGTER